MARNKSYWIKERHNPQLGVYYVPCGQITKKEALSYIRALYGDNIMHEYKTEAEYTAEIQRLKDANKNVHD